MIKNKVFTVSNTTLAKSVLIILTMMLLVTKIAIVSAKGEELQVKQIAPQLGENICLVGNDNSEFQKGREFLDQAWIALENDDDKLAVRYFAAAERQFSKALEATPDDIPMLMNRGTAYVGLQRYESALEDFDKVLELDAIFAPAYEGKALAYEAMGEIGKAQEMQEASDAIYIALASQGEQDLVPDNPSAPDGYGTWYASNARHNYTNRFTGQRTINASGFGCGVTQPWKINVENAVYFNLPWNTWGRNTQGFKCAGLCNWVSLNANTQGYTNAPPFLGWTTPSGENYVLLIAETEVCLFFWHQSHLILEFQPIIRAFV